MYCALYIFFSSCEGSCLFDLKASTRSCMGCWFRREQLNSASRFSSLSQSLRSWHMQTACNLSEDTNIAQTHGKNYMPHILFLFWVLLIVNTAPRSRRRGWALWRRSEGSLSREGNGSQTAEMKESRARKSLPMSSAVVIFRPPPAFTRCCHSKKQHAQLEQGNKVRTHAKKPTCRLP